MSSKKTDWQIARGLADWVLTLGLGQSCHQKWMNGEELGWSADTYVRTYVDGKYVSLEYCEDGELKHTIDIHGNALGDSVGFNEKLQTPEELVAAAEQLANNLNIRYWNKVYRNKLRFLVKNAKQREAAIKKAKIKKLEEELVALKKDVK